LAIVQITNKAICDVIVKMSDYLTIRVSIYPGTTRSESSGESFTLDGMCPRNYPLIFLENSH